MLTLLSNIKPIALKAAFERCHQDQSVPFDSLIDQGWPVSGSREFDPKTSFRHHQNYRVIQSNHDRYL
jgi:hypothetical protein